jgi:predicted transcriptional regulator
MIQELEKIKQMRQKLGLTQTELAKLSGVSQSLITKIERGRLEPSYSIVIKLFNVLDEKLADIQKEIIAKNICTKKISFIKSNDSIDNAIKLMKKYAISQIPVIDENVIVGSISEETFIKNYSKIKNKEMKVKEIMDEPFPTISEDTHLTLIRNILKTYSAIILTKYGKPTGIITKADLLKKL